MYVDQSPLVARRLGFAAIPMAVLSVLLGAQSVHLLFVQSDPSSATSESPTQVTWWLGDDVLRRAQWIVLGILFWLW